MAAVSAFRVVGPGGTATLTATAVDVGIWVVTALAFSGANAVVIVVGRLLVVGVFGVTGAIGVVVSTAGCGCSPLLVGEVDSVVVNVVCMLHEPRRAAGQPTAHSGHGLPAAPHLPTASLIPLLSAVEVAPES